MTISEIKKRINEIDFLLDSNISDEKFTTLEEEAKNLTLEFGRIERLENLKSVKEIKNLNDWTKKFLLGFPTGTRTITNKQAQIFSKIGHGKPFIFNGRRYDFNINYRVGFGHLIITTI